MPGNRHTQLCCLEGSTMSNLVHRQRRCARIDLHDYAAWRAVRQRKGRFILVYRLAMDARPERVMMWLAENIQACLRIFRRAQHQWLARDILHQPQGGLFGFCLMARIHRTNPSYQSNPW